MKSIYDMNLHESQKLIDGTWIFRVPGGWIYSRYDTDEAEHNERILMQSVFVPFSNE